MIDPQAMFCTVLKDDVDAMPAWSEMKDRLQRIAWNNGCTWVAPPDGSPTASNWGAPERQPPRSYTTPGNPDNRQPPEN